MLCDTAKLTRCFENWCNLFKKAESMWHFICLFVCVCTRVCALPLWPPRRLNLRAACSSGVLDYLHHIIINIRTPLRPSPVPLQYPPLYSFYTIHHVSIIYIPKVVSIKVLMQGKLIAVAYTLRTYWNQFSLGGICKQE